MIDTRFTTANAREMAARSHAARKAAALAPQPEPQSSDEYVANRITSARAQIDRLTAQARKVTDPLDSERLARAVAQWSEIERILAGRPLPGSKRLGLESPRVPQVDIEPL